ncbi:MAG TPA: P-loop NTPase fold protein [Bosea sp. (in: a-proteobacteria)]
MRLSDALALARSDAARAILHHAAQRAIQRDGEAEPSIGLLLMLQGALAAGLQMPAGRESTPRWLVDFVVARGLSASDIASVRAPAKPTPASGEILLRPAAATAIHMAQVLAAATVNRRGFDARHLVVAALDCPDVSAAHQMRLDFAALGLDLAELRDALIARIIRTPEKGEDVALWEQLRTSASAAWSRIIPQLGSSVDAAAATAGPAAATTVSGFHADRATIGPTDPLGIGADVSAFARLICLEEARPPLSIGLFGEWGSGKSCFMEGLQGEITALTRKERSSRRAEAEAEASPGSSAAPKPSPRFVQNVVQIRFNAWHYADANLWASLTAEFFEQLRAGGVDRQGHVVHARLVERVNAHVHNLTSTISATREALGDSERKLAEAQKVRDNAVEAVERAQNEALSQTLVDEIGSAYAQHKQDLFEIGRRAYQDDVTKGIDDFIAVAKDVQTLGGQFTTVLSVVKARGWRLGLMTLGVLIALVALASLALIDKTPATSFLTWIDFWGLLVGVASASAALLPAIRIVGGLMKSTAGFAEKLDSVTKDKLKQVLASEVQLKEAAAEAKARREAVERAQKALARYVDPASASNPPRLLRYVLEDDPETRVFDSHIGLISRARRLFQSVDEIVKEQREKRKAGEQGDIDVPDRIVLYIDDLDRCTHAQVYDVLQAIHLLLAFELFVVVVGVDVRWVEEAVARQFAPAPTERSTTATQEEREVDRRKRAIEYLEKIFQLPFWLRALSTAGEAGGSYGAYVKDLLQGNLQVPEDTEAPFAAKRGELAFKTSMGPEGDDAAEPLSEDASAPEAATVEELASIDQALATIRLTQPEVDFLASPEIGAIAAKSPRAVKRLINVYRIIRARMSEAELAEFLGTNDNPPTWPVAVFLAAVECGQPVDVADAWYEGLAGIDQGHTLAELAPDDDPTVPNILIEPNLYPGYSAKAYKSIESARFKLKRLKHIATTIELHRGGVSVNVADMLAMARIVRRYSFNRYH